MISADLIAQLPMTKSGNTQIVVFVDPLSKMVQFAAVLTASTGYNMARLFLHNLIRLHGTQREIVSDRDTLFTSAFWEELTAALGTKLAMSTACHPASDGQTERTNRTLDEMKRHFVSPTQDDWDEHLDAGQQPLTPASVQVYHHVPAAKAFTPDLQEAVETATAALASAQDMQAEYANHKRHGVTYKVGDSMLSSTKNIRTKHLGAEKLLSKWIGPCKVVEKVNQVAYQLDLPEALGYMMCFMCHYCEHVSQMVQFSHLLLSSLRVRKSLR